MPAVVMVEVMVMGYGVCVYGLGLGLMGGRVVGRRAFGDWLNKRAPKNLNFVSTIFEIIYRKI